MGKSSYKFFSFIKAAALALALGIGVNGAIFSLEGLNRSTGIYPDPMKLLFQSDAQLQAADSSGADQPVCATEQGDALEPDENLLPCAFANMQRCDSILAYICRFTAETQRTQRLR